MSPCHHADHANMPTIHTMLTIETVMNMETVLTMPTVPTMEAMMTALTVATMEKQCCMGKQHRTNISNEVLNVIIFL